jgi:hypothetical protein
VFVERQADKTKHRTPICGWKLELSSNKYNMFRVSRVPVSCRVRITPPPFSIDYGNRFEHGDGRATCHYDMTFCRSFIPTFKLTVVLEHNFHVHCLPLLGINAWMYVYMYVCLGYMCISVICKTTNKDMFVLLRVAW